jgi:hypothetical protein
MITNGDIVQVLRSHVPTDRRIAVLQILQIVEDNCQLTVDDWYPHPSEVVRNSNYPAWKRKVQAVLHNLKRRHKVEHFSDAHDYIFYSSSFG